MLSNSCSVVVEYLPFPPRASLRGLVLAVIDALRGLVLALYLSAGKYKAEAGATVCDNSQAAQSGQTEAPATNYLQAKITPYCNRMVHSPQPTRNLHGTRCTIRR